MALILVVDDEPDMRLALGTVLKKQGHSVVEAGDGESALSEIGRKPVELMLLDIRLPGMDGVQVLKKARQSRSDLPILMLTGYGSVDTAVKLMQSGADGYLSKPFSNQRLVEAVEKALVAHRLSADPLNRELAEKLQPFKAPPKPREIPLAPPRARPRSMRWLADLVGMAVAVALLLYFDPFHWRAQAPAVANLQIPFSNPTALVWKNGELWASDWVTQGVYRLHLQGGGFVEDGEIPLGRTHVTGFAFDGKYVYTCDSWRHVIQRRRLDDTLSLVKQFRSPGPNPSGLYWDGRYLWSLDSSAHRIYQHDPSSLTVLASYPSPGKAPVGLIKLGDSYWSADAETRLFYKHREDPQFTVLGKYTVEDLQSGSEPLSAFTVDDKGVWWVARDGRNSLMSMPQAALVPQP